MRRLSILLAALLPLTLMAGGGRNRVVGSEAIIPPARAPITVDGDLGEWDEAEAILLTTGDAGNAGHGKGAFDDVNARVAFRYDTEALYVAAWYQDPTPLGTGTTPGVVPATDGLVLHLPQAGTVHHVALWKVPQEDASRALHSVGRVDMSQGEAVPSVRQGFKTTGATTYTQEARIPWDVLGGRPADDAKLRLGVELVFGGIDLTAGYQQWLDELAAQGSSGSRWGGNLSWGFVDGIREEKIVDPRFDPANGLQVTLTPAGTEAAANPAIFYNGNERTRTTNMVAVPAPAGGIVVDGRFEDGEWALRSGTTIASEPSLFPQRYETRVHWAYGADGLYVGLRWFTGGSQLNINNPARLNRGYDGGDALQIRLGTDRVSHVDTWFYTAGWRAAMTIGYGARFDEGNLPDALAAGAKMAIEPLSDGYTQELFLPWALITKEGKALAEGDSFRAIFDLFYSGVERNRIPFIVNAQLAALTGVVDMPFTAPREGFYTAVIETAAGEGVRHLLAHKKLPAGAILSDWDGLNDAGELMPAGEYRVRGLHHTGVGLKYLMSYMNPGQPSWQTYDGTGEWGGDHCPPQAVAADSHGVYLAWPSAEDGNGIIGTDFTGKKTWSFFQTPQPTGAGTAVLASDERYLYFVSDILKEQARAITGKNARPMGSFETIVACLDRETGNRRGFTTDTPYRTIASFTTDDVPMAETWQLWQNGSFDLDNHGLHDDYYFSGRSISANATGMVARDGKLYISMRLSGEIAVYSVEPFAELARIKVPKPAGLAFAADGRLLAISGDSVVAVAADGTLTPVVAGGLDKPVDLAVDASGTLYVSQWGKSHSVAVFDAAGKALRTIGTPGGRPTIGAYDANGMLLPRGIDVDKEGQLWVCEDDNYPRRVSVWNAATGALIREFVGGTTYGATRGGMLDPQDATRAISLGNLYEIDLSKEGYRPIATMWRRVYGDQIFGLHDGWGHNTAFVEMNGQRYITNSAMGIVTIGKWKADGTWQACAAVGGVFGRSDNPQVVTPENRLWRMDYFPDYYRAHGGENFVWTDLNDDGRAQEEEFQWEKQSPDFPCLGQAWGPGNVNPTDQAVTIAGMFGKGEIFRFPLQGFTDTGAPRYDIAKRELILTPNERISAAITDSKGNLFTNQLGEWRKPGNDPALRGYDRTGKLLWRYPTQRDVRPMGTINGEGFLGPVDAGGELGEIFGLSQWHGGHVPLMTTDGLYVGRLLRDPSAGGDPGPDVYRGETVQHLNRLDDGRIILAHGKNAHHMMQITGLDTVQRFSVAFTLTPAQAALAATRLADRVKQTAGSAPIRVVLRPAPPIIDGDLSDWDQPAADIGPADSLPRATVRLAYGRDHLYLAYDVTKADGYINLGQDPLRLFLSGDAVDLQFGADPAARAERKEPVMGDTRLLLAEHEGKAIAVVYRAKVPGATEPVAFRSPTRAVSFDQVETIADAEVAIVPTPTGYRVEAAVPMKALIGDFMWPGRVMQGDAGIIAADKTGRRVARVYRFNQDTGIVNDIPSEATLGIRGWGELEVDPLEK